MILYNLSFIAEPLRLKVFSVLLKKSFYSRWRRTWREKVGKRTTFNCDQYIFDAFKTLWKISAFITSPWTHIHWSICMYDKSFGLLYIDCLWYFHTRSGKIFEKIIVKKGQIFAWFWFTTLFILKFSLQYCTRHSFIMLFLWLKKTGAVLKCDLSSR